MKRLFQYQAKTEPVLVPAAADTSAEEFAATSPSLSTPVRPIINIALLVTALFFVAEAEPAVNKLSWYQPFSEPVQVAPRLTPSPYVAESLEPIAAPAPVPDFGWYVELSSPVRSEEIDVPSRYRARFLTGFAVPSAGDANELRDFTQLSEPVKIEAPLNPSPYVAYVGEPITEELAPSMDSWYRQFVVPARLPERALNPPYVIYEGELVAPSPPANPLTWYQQLSEPVRPVDRATYVQEPIPLTTTSLPGDSPQLREFIQLPDVVRSVPRFTWDQYLRIDSDVLVPIDFREGWYQPLSEPVRPLESATYVQEPSPLTTTSLPGDADALREFIQLPDVVRPVELVAQDQFLAIDPDVRIPIDLREGWFQALSEPVRPVKRATDVQEPIPLTTTFLSGDATRLREFIQLPDVVKLPARTPSDPFLFFDPEPLPDALDVFSDSWYQQLSEPVREPPQAIPSAPYEPVVQFPGDATELAEFIPFQDVARPPDKAINTGITAFAVKSVSIKWFQALSDPVWPIEHPVYVQEPIPLTTTFLSGDADALREFIQLSDVIRLPVTSPFDQFLFFDPFPIPESEVDLEWYQQLSEPVRSQAILVQTGYYTESLEPIVAAAIPDFGWYQPPADIVRPPVFNEGGIFQRLLTPQELLDLIPNYGYFRPFSIPVDLRKPRNDAALSQDYINPAFDVAGVKTPWIKSTTGVDGWAQLSEPADTWTKATGPTSGWDKFTKGC